MSHSYVRAGEVLRLERRPVVPVSTREYTSIGIRSFGKGIFHYEPTPGDRLGKLRFFEVAPDRLILSNIKAWEGAVALSTEADAGCVASNRFLTYVPLDGRINLRWARWYFLSDAGNESLQRASPGSADRNRTLAIDRFEALEILLPPMAAQVRLAEYLDRVEVAARQAREYSQYASALSAALTVSIASRPDLSNADKEKLGWRSVRLGSAMQIASSRVTVESHKSYSNVGVYSFGRGLFSKPDIDGGSTSATGLYRIKHGQFIYSRLFAFEGAYTYVTPEFDGYYMSNEFPAFDTDPKQLDARWLTAFLRSPERWAELGGRSQGLGVRRQRVPADAVLDYKTWLPPIATQKAMLAAIGDLEQAAKARQAASKHIDALLPAALNEAFAAIS